MLVIFLLILPACLCQFNDTGIQNFINAHNNLRSEIANGKYIAKNNIQKAAGTNIMKMTWDEDLATASQSFASSCPVDHSTDRVNIGENLYFWQTGKKTTLDVNNYLAISSCKLWADEFQKNGWNSNDFTYDLFHTEIGHATQMAWAASKKVGCGVQKCDVGDGTKYVVVCQYYPAGNVIGRKIYETGDTCSNCPSGSSCGSDGLCA